MRREYQVRGRDWYYRTMQPWESVQAGDATWAAYTYYKNSKKHLDREIDILDPWTEPAAQGQGDRRGDARRALRMEDR